MPKISSYPGFVPILTDLLYGVDDPGGTPISDNMEIQDLLTLLEAATSTVTNKTQGDDLLPDTDSARDLGSVAKAYAEVHADSIFVGGSEFSGAALSDPGADRIAFWDDTAGTVAWLSLVGLTIVGTVMAVDKEVSLEIFASVSAVTTGDGTSGISIPASMDGYNVEDVVCTVHDKGITGTTDVQLRRRRAGSDVDVFSTKVTIGDEFFANDGVVNGSNDDLATGDILYIDVDAIHSGTAPNGLSVAITAKRP